MFPTSVLRLTRTGRLLVLALACAGAGMADAQAPASAPAKVPERGVAEWLARMQTAPRQHNYIGTFVVSASDGTMSSARIWHAGSGRWDISRVENLSGPPRSTFQRNDEVVTLLPEQKLARIERRESQGQFPRLLKSTEASIADFYSVRQMGSDRVAGFDTDVVLLVPRDAQRFGYRAWTERRSGLLVKLQTMGPSGEVLEQSAFSELQLDAPVRAEKLAQMMVAPAGWRVEHPETVKTTAQAEGWSLKSAVPGFAPMDCYRRRARSGGDAMQWVFSDGLASVSLFIEPFDPQRHGKEGLLASGATHTLTHRVQDWWVTAVGEVPAQTLRAFAQNLERRR